VTSTSPTYRQPQQGGTIATDALRTIETFNNLPDAEVAAALASCLDVPRWVHDVMAGRPYDDEVALIGQARASAAALSEAEVNAALARHPRIGERAGTGHDEAFSTAEQSAVDGSDTRVARALELGNAAYERRFDRVFLIRAAGRSANEILAELERRLANNDSDEQAEVVAQLGEIAILRLEQVVRR
jgi:OHCU decarboxylase